MTLTKSDITAIKEALQPEFETLKTSLVRRMDRGFRQNRKDHNSILKYLDERDSRLEKRIIKLEEHCGLPPLQ